MVSVHLSHGGRARPDVKGAVSVRLVLESGTVLGAWEGPGSGGQGGLS